MLLENDLEVWLRKVNDKLDRIFFIEKEWKKRGERKDTYVQGRNYEWLLNLFKNFFGIFPTICHDYAFFL